MYQESFHMTTVSSLLVRSLEGCTLEQTRQGPYCLSVIADLHMIVIRDQYRQSRKRFHVGFSPSGRSARHPRSSTRVDTHRSRCCVRAAGASRKLKSHNVLESEEMRHFPDRQGGVTLERYSGNGRTCGRQLLMTSRMVPRHMAPALVRFWIVSVTGPGGIA